MSFPRYPEYKDSGVEWLGEVPAHWGLMRFKWQIERNDGGVWGDEPDGEDDTVVLRSTEQTVDGHWKLDDPAMRKLSEAEKASSLLATGDLLVTKSSGSALHIGKTTLVTQEIAAMKCCYSNFMQRIRTKTGIASKLAWYLMNSEIARVQFDLASNSSTGLANLNGSMIGELVLGVPSSSEQAEVVAFLDHETAKIDALVAEQLKLIALLKEKRQAFISHAVTKGLNPDAPMKDSGIEWLGEVPAHWAAAPMKYVVKLQSGGTPSKDRLDYWEGDIPWASAKDMKVDRLVDTEDHITAHAIEEGAAVTVPAGSVVVVVRGMILARIFPVALTMCEITINQDLKAIRCCDRLHSGFFAWYLRGTADESLCRLDEAGHGTKALRMDAWTSMEIALPPLAEQQEIAEFVEASCARFDALIGEAGNAMNHLKERRSALISAAVTGKIDVRGFAAEKEAA